MTANTDFEKKKERHASGQSTVSSDSVSNYIPTPPDGGYGWVVVFAAFCIHVIVDGVTFTFGVFYVAFLEYFAEGNAKTSLVGSLLGGFYLMICFVASALVNKFGCRPVSIAGSLISSVSFVLCTLSPNIDVLMFTYGVMGGSGFALMFFPSVISVSFYFQKRRAAATGIAVCGAGVGGFVMAPFGRYLLDIYDWKNAMLIVAGITLNGCVFGAMLRPLEPPKKKKRPRQKNIVDRLVEHTKKKRNRKESECSACAHGGTTHTDMMMRIQEVKQAREDMLRDEDSEYEFGTSVPNSTVNSVRRLDRSDSVASAGYAPARSLNIQIPRQEALRREAASQASGSPPTSLGMSPPWFSNSPPGMGSSAPPNYPNSPAKGSDSVSLLSNNLPTIIIENDLGTPCEGDENGGQFIPANTSEDQSDIVERRRSANFQPLIEEDEAEEVQVSASLPNGKSIGAKNAVLDKLKKENGNITMNGSLPNGIPYADKLTNGTLDSNNCLVEGRRRHHSKSAGDVNALQTPRRKAMPPRSVQKIDYSRPLYRKDIFYSGSMLNVTHFHPQPDVKMYVKSMMSIPETVPPEKESCLCRWLPKSVTDTIREMMDITLFREPIFLVAAVGNLFAFIGLFVPFVFIADRAFTMGISVDKAAFLLSVIGITNMLGRLIAGALADLKRVSPLLLHNMSLLIGGVACVLNMFSDSYAQMCVFASVFGLCVAAFISLTSIVLCNMLGLERLTNAYGLLCAIRGIASIAGPPVAGMVFDQTGNYDTSFHVGGVMLFGAGLIFSTLHLPFFQRLSWNNSQQDAGHIEVIFDDDIAAAYNAPNVTAVGTTENGSVTLLNDQILPEPEMV